MPMDRSRYPKNWPEISRAVRAAAGNRCQFCRAENHRPHPATGSRVVLTVAHLDDDPQNNDPRNLRALCQRCHLAYDAPIHAAHARETWRRKRLARAQLARRLQPSLFDLVDEAGCGEGAQSTAAPGNVEDSAPSAAKTVPADL